MKKIRVMTVFGTRPEAVKMAPLVIELRKNPHIEVLCAVTAQHRQMLDSVLDIFGIRPDFDLDIMSPRQTLSDITVRALPGLERVFRETSPDLVLVHGDTSTTFAGALAAFYNKIMIGHVEAGLRTGDRYSPFPEEMNRVLTDSLSDLCFAPTRQNKENLLRENTKAELFVTGNTVIDAMQYTVKEDYIFSNPDLASVDFRSRRVVVLTAHRRENYGEPLRNIMGAVRDLADRFDDCLFIYPVHLSPEVRDTASSILSGHPGVMLIDPVPVDEMHNLLSRCSFVMTDSGGLQEEAPSLGKPVLVLRRETERGEAVAAGTVRLAGTEREDIVSLGERLLTDRELYDAMARSVNPYGDGKACERIAQAITWRFGLDSGRPADYLWEEPR